MTAAAAVELAAQAAGIGLTLLASAAGVAALVLLTVDVDRLAGLDPPPPADGMPPA